MHRFLSLILCFAAFVAVAEPKKNQHVIIVTIDGCAAYLLEDPKSPIPNLRKLAAEGVTGKGMKVSDPSVTWPNHTTISTGVRSDKHSVLYNGKLTRGAENEPLGFAQELDQSVLVAVPTIYDFLHTKGFRTAAINWPCTKNASTLDDNFPDVPNMIKNSSPRLMKELVTKKIIPEASDAFFSKETAAARDDIWTQAACHVLRTRKPNFMFFHLLLVDGRHHQFGPQSEEGYKALAHADKNIGELMEAINDAGIRENTTLFIVSDHGFEAVTNVIKPNVAFRKAGLLDSSKSKNNFRAQSKSEGGTALVYLKSKTHREEDRAKVTALLKNEKGISKIIQPADFAKYGYPSPEINPQMGDLVLAAADGYSFSNEEDGDNVVTMARPNAERRGSHGFLAENPKMNAIFIVWGKNVPAGKKIGLTENVDLAPTTAYLLGEEFPNSEGKILKEIFTK